MKPRENKLVFNGWLFESRLNVDGRSSDLF